jgi:phosphate transport system protein
MEHHLDHELDELKRTILRMAGHAESAVNNAMRALAERDYDLALRVREKDRVLDQFEIEVDDLAIRLLAKAPLAGDLRFVTTAMKVSQNLERVGDEAVKIAKRARDLCPEAPLKIQIDLPEMARLALKLLKASLDAFVNRDSAAARAVLPRDKEVDALNKQINRELTRRMMEDSDAITRCLHLGIVSRSLERIADHAKNIAEEVVYLCEAEDIRHTGKMNSGGATQ